MVEANTMIETDIYTGLTLDGKTKMNVKGVYLTPYKWSATERRLLLVKSEKYKPFYAFEVNYSKWATYNINKFEDITILKTFDKDDYFYQKGDYYVALSGESFLEEAQDTMYENWCGNLEVRKQYKEKNEFWCELEVFLEDREGFDITEVNSDLRFIIPRKDYLKLKKIFNE
tara:strand:- start:1705 stop:2220 length:516 start_codon:yes stop_codon:yes gene_type:complete